MRGIKVFVIGIFLFMVINSHFLFCLEDDEWDKDNYGKIIGQIVDAETGEPVKEKFIIWFYTKEKSTHIYSPIFSYEIYTDENGVFSINTAKPDVYVLNSCPRSTQSNYSADPNPHDFKETYQEIKVEKGKITKVLKKVFPAGRIKVVTIDINGNKIVPGEYFESVTIGDHYRIKTPDGDWKNYFFSEFSYLGNDMDGEWTHCHVYPGTYYMKISFKNMGYGSREYKNIVVEKNKTTEIRVLFDLNDQTGIFGKVTDENGNLLEGIRVRIRETDDSDDFRIKANISTDEYGNYKIVGLEEGSYNITFSKSIPNFFSKNKIYITKNTVKELNKKLTARN